MIDIGLLLKNSQTKKPISEIGVSPEFITAFRRKYSLSKTTLAKLIGVSRKTIYNWEDGKGQIKGSGAVLLCLLNRHPSLIHELWDNNKSK